MYIYNKTKKMKKVVRLSESELTKLIKNVVKESKRNKVNEDVENYFNPEAMQTGEAIVTIVTTVIGMLGIAGSQYIKASIEKLRDSGNDVEAEQVQKALDTAMETIDLDPSGMGEVSRKRYNKDMGISDEEPMDPMAESIRRNIRRR
jgi:hypothetical protein